MNNNYTLLEIKRKKDETRNKIEKILTDFSNDTGVMIKLIQLYSHTECPVDYTIILKLDEI